jgi:hypothetical protein
MIPDLSGGALAQLVEHLTFNQVVGRSSRPRPTTFSLYINSLRVYLVLLIYRFSQNTQNLHKITS